MIKTLLIIFLSIVTIHGKFGTITVAGGTFLGLLQVQSVIVFYHKGSSIKEIIADKFGKLPFMLFASRYGFLEILY